MTLSQRQVTDGSDVPLLKIIVESLGVQLAAREFDTSLKADLGGIYVQHLLFKGFVWSEI